MCLLWDLRPRLSKIRRLRIKALARHRRPAYFHFRAAHTPPPTAPEPHFAQAPPSRLRASTSMKRCAEGFATHFPPSSLRLAPTIIASATVPLAPVARIDSGSGRRLHADFPTSPGRV